MAPRTAPADPTVDAASAPLAGVAELTSALACAAHAPAVLVTIDPELEDGALAYGTACDSVARVGLGADLLPDQARLRGVLAHEIAHHALAHGQGAVRIWQRGTYLALGALLAAVVIGAPDWVPVAAAAIAAVLHLITAWCRRREEYAADIYSVRLLEAAGLDGHAIVTTTLDTVAQESRWYRLAGWIGGSHPTPDARRRNIAYSRWAPHP
ncbi:M48 family metalloprotease [Streptosporangium canum]|uniref:M48 family metalloprotease n=1 Tax=Streptosporangium canum TaxID=324952 RepID=UPI003419A4CB